MWNTTKIFDDLGGPSGVYKLLEDEPISYSAVRNWKVRPGGIPGYWMGVLFTKAKAADKNFNPDKYLEQPAAPTSDSDSPF